MIVLLVMSVPPYHLIAISLVFFVLLKVPKRCVAAFGFVILSA